MLSEVWLIQYIGQAYCITRNFLMVQFFVDTAAAVKMRKFYTSLGLANARSR